ncbi:MAG: DNA-binding protein [Chloroflexi bacterium HGW-Chloroflexi-1]|nr:MAG: DNA-binding protein [Chloroflexi bacterium HGW-Chloroflexi-1]
MPESKQEIGLYIDHARKMLEVAAHNIADGFYGSAINRAYYAIFYAANALLVTRGVARGKHSGVIAAFREQFVKPGLIEAEYSRVYGRVMDNRHVSDYEIELGVEAEVAGADLRDARRFVERAESLLRDEGWL